MPGSRGSHPNLPIPPGFIEIGIVIEIEIERFASGYTDFDFDFDMKSEC